MEHLRERLRANGEADAETRGFREIASNAADAARVAASAAQLAERTNASVTRLGETSSQIGNVVALSRSKATRRTTGARRSRRRVRGPLLLAGRYRHLMALQPARLRRPALTAPPWPWPASKLSTVHHSS